MGQDSIEAVTGAIAQGNPGKATGDVAAFFATEVGGVLATALIIGVILLVTWASVRIVKHFFKKLENRLRAAGNTSAALVGFACHIVVAVIWFAGICAAIGSITPLEKMLNKLLAAGGVLAVVAGIASQEALGSVVSGFMILAFKPFVLGDVVRYVDNDISGVIEEITLRHTVIRTWENKRVIVPNSKMNSAIIENADYGDSTVCVLLDVGVTYESDLERAKILFAQEIERHPAYFDHRTADEIAAGAPKVLVRVQALAPSSVVLRAWLWAQDNAAAAALKSEILQGVKASFERDGIDLAYPHLVVVTEKKGE